MPVRQAENGRSYGFKGKGFGLAWGAASTPHNGHEGGESQGLLVNMGARPPYPSFREKGERFLN